MTLRLVSSSGSDAAASSEDAAEIVDRLRALGLVASERGDTGAVTVPSDLPPAPAPDSDQTVADMAALYGAALLRDVAFADWGEDETVATVAAALATVPADGPPRVVPAGPVPPGRLFRATALGAVPGPYVSQFLLVGTPARPAARWRAGGGLAPTEEEGPRPEDGIVRAGAQTLSQRMTGYLTRLDHGTDWTDGKDSGAVPGFETHARFVSTPRDLASLADLSAPCQAHRTACLILLAAGQPLDGGLSRAAGSFGADAIQALLAEAAALALRALRDLPPHARPAPAEIGADLALAHAGDPEGRLGPRRAAFDALARELERTGLLDRVAIHNAYQNKLWSGRDGRGDLGPLDAMGNVLLPLALVPGAAEGTARLNRAVAAGAGATVLKACFETFDAWPRAGTGRSPGRNGAFPAPLFARPRALTGKDAMLPVPFEADPQDPTHLRPAAAAQLTLEGEIDKLAANLAMGACFAGQATPSETRAALRLGERVAVDLLVARLHAEAAPASLRLTSFDGDRLMLSTGSDPEDAPIRVWDATGRGGDAATLRAWRTRRA